MTNSKIEKLRDELALKQRIYEPKYGGKDHSGYEVMLKYEVNYERDEAFCAGFDASTAIHQQQIQKLVEAIMPIYLQMKRGIKISTKEELLNLENAINQNQGE